MSHLLVGMPQDAPSALSTGLRFADIAVTATAKDFAGFYRGKQYHSPDFPAALDRALAAGVEKVVLTDMSLADVQFNADIARSRPDQCSITVGVHPYHGNEPETDEKYLDQLFDLIENSLRDRPGLVVAFGELGLDYDHLDNASKEAQLRTFQRQLDIFVAKKLDLPLFLHCRAAFDDFSTVIRPYLPQLPRGGVVHSFVGSSDQMRQLIGMGFDVSVNGFSFRNRESLEMVRDLPMEKLQIETDAPWGEILPTSEVAVRYLKHARQLPQSKKRDKFEMGMMVKGRNESCTMERVALIVAGLKGISVDEVAKTAWDNSTKMFRL